MTRKITTKAQGGNAFRAGRFWNGLEVPKSKKDFFDAVTTPAPVGTGTVATIRLYGPIDSWGGFWGISTKDVGMVLDALPDSVEQIILRLNSPGGEVFEAVSILNMLRAHKASITAVVDGLAASAASVIAAGCDETVMSPGTQMLIHSPWNIAIGNASDLRKEADVLDNVQLSLVEIYQAKAGDQDWATLLDEETWLTAEQAVAMGLADRVAVIPDAGETETVGDEEEEVVLLVPGEGDDDDADDMLARVRSAMHPNLAAAALPPQPPLTESGSPINSEGDNVSYESLRAGIRDRLGMTDADASDETVLAALEEALEEQLETPVAPEGTVLIDAAVLTDLQAAAADGRQALATQTAARRDGIVLAAVRDGRIAPASRDAWRAQLDTNEEGTVTLLDSLARNTVPVAELGESGGAEASEDDALYNQLFGTQPTEKKEV